MSKISFHLLFDENKISLWKDEYLNYKECRKIIKELYALNKSIKEKERKLKQTKSESEEELIKMEIEEISKIKYNSIKLGTKLRIEFNIFQQSNEHKVIKIKEFFENNLHKLNIDLLIIKEIHNEKENTEVSIFI